MQTLVQNFGVVMYLTPVTRSSDSAIDTAGEISYLSLKGYSKATFIMQCGAMTEATTVVKAYQAKSVSGSSVSSTALTITHYWTDVSSSSATGVLARTSTTSSGMTVDSTNNGMYVMEVDAKQLNATSDYDCVGLVFTGISSATLFGVTAILHPARYASDPMVIDANTD